MKNKVLKKDLFGNLEDNEQFILKTVFFMFIINGLFAMILGPLLPIISKEYGLSDTFSGMLLSSHQVGNLISGFIAGIIPVYLGRKKSVFGLFSLVIFGFLFILLFNNPLLLILGFVLTGLSRGSTSNFSNTIVNDITNGNNTAMNLLHATFAIGALLAPFLIIVPTSLLNEKIGWKISILIIVLLSVIALYLISKFKFTNKKELKNEKKISYEFFKDSKFWISSGILFFYLCTESTVTGFMVKYFVDTSIMSLSYAQILSSLLWLVILLGRIFVAYMSTKYKKSILLLISSIGTSIFYFMLLNTTNIVYITILIAVMGFSMAGIYPTTISTVSNTISKYPSAMGVLLLLGGLGGILMPTITGALSDSFGIFAGMSAIVVSNILMLLFIFIFLLKVERQEAK